MSCAVVCDVDLLMLSQSHVLHAHMHVTPQPRPHTHPPPQTSCEVLNWTYWHHPSVEAADRAHQLPAVSPL